jgi:predicted nucleotidyltransferase
MGLPYASARQKAAEAVLGAKANLMKSPNNLLGIEYLRALDTYDSRMQPLTVRRSGGEHDSDGGYSASALRKALLNGRIPLELMPGAAVAVCMEEMVSGRGPVFMKRYEQAVLSRLRAVTDFSVMPGASEGLDIRFKRYATIEPTVDSILTHVKTKRYAMSRLRRLLMCAVLGISAEVTQKPPPYIRVLAMNDTGKKLLGLARKKTELPVITKPASVHRASNRISGLFHLEAAATDFYVLAYADESQRCGGQEWKHSPVIV